MVKLKKKKKKLCYKHKNSHLAGHSKIIMLAKETLISANRMIKELNKYCNKT